MFSIFKKSAERIAGTLFPVTVQVGENIVAGNFLRLTEGTAAHRRFAMSVRLFSALLCQEMLPVVDKDRVRAVGVCDLLTKAHLAAVSSIDPASVRLTDMVVWTKEIDWIRQHPLDDQLIDVDLFAIYLPVRDIVRELSIVRMVQLSMDVSKGAIAELQHEAWALSLYKPMCSSLLMQITGDEACAANNEMVTDFATRISIQYMLLWTSVNEALR